jgi:hypothetical protein
MLLWNSRPFWNRTWTRRLKANAFKDLPGGAKRVRPTHDEANGKRISHLIGFSWASADTFRRSLRCFAISFALSVTESLKALG